MAQLANRSTPRRRASVPDVRSSLAAPVVAVPVQRLHGSVSLPVPAVRSAPPPSPARTRPSWTFPLLVDAAAATLGASLWGLAGLHLSGPREALLMAVTGVVWLAVLAGARSYSPRLHRSARESVREVLTAALALLCLAGLVGLLLGVHLPREDVLGGVAALTALTVTSRGLARWAVARRRSAPATRIAVVGERDDVVRRFVEDLPASHSGGCEVAAVCLLGDGSGEWYDGHTLRGVDALANAVERLHLDAVVVLPSPDLGPDRIRRLAWRLERHGTHLFVVPALPEVSRRRVALSQVGGAVAVHVRHAELHGVRRLAKEAFDRVAAAAALTLALPFLAVLMLAVRLDSPGPSLFRQERVGKDGRRFTMLKLRTMTTDAEERRAALADRNELDGVLFKIRHDPRVTRVGALLRRYSLDEIPQLVNVLCGHMSLVGPRPPLPSEVAAYEEPVYRRLAVKPGITGLWQVSGRSNLSWAESVRLDLRYVENWSLGLDAAILWRTGKAVLEQDGAY